MHKANKPVANRNAKFKDLKNQEITLYEAEGLVSGDQWEYILYAFYTCKGDFALPAPELFQFYSTISVGDFPKCFLKTVLKYPTLAKPQSSLTSVTVYFRDCNNSKA